MTTATGSDGLTYDYDTETKELKISGTGGISSLSGGSTAITGTDLDILGATSVEIGEGISSIPRYCFYGIRATLTGTIRIPSTVTTIKYGAFVSCKYIQGFIFEGQPTTLEEACIYTDTTDGIDIYSKGWANSTTITSTELGSTTATFVTGVPTAYYGLKIGGNKVQVDSAVRDGQGNKIDSTYAVASTTNSAIATKLTGNTYSGHMGVGTLNPGETATGYITLNCKKGYQYLIFFATYETDTEMYLASNGYGWQEGNQYVYIQGRNNGSTAKSVGGPWICFEVPHATETSHYTFQVMNGTKTLVNYLAQLDLSNVNVGSANSGKVLSVDSDGTITYVTAGAGSVTDVTVNGTSVMDGTVAKITVPTFDATNEYILES